MTDYAKLQVSVVYSENADYSDPKFISEFTAMEYVPTAFISLRVSAATAGTAVELGTFTTPAVAIVKNRDATNYVTATFLNAAGVAQSQVILAGEIATIVDIKASGDLTLTANTAAVSCDVLILGV